MKKQILIIDDDPVLVHLLTSTLQADGFEVNVAYDGMEGLAIAQRLLPDLIILDVMMPKVNGYTVCSVLKDTEPYRTIPIIILTARSSETDKQFDPEFKPEVFMNKPFQSEELLGKVKQLVG